MSEISEAIQRELGYIENEWGGEQNRRYACNFCGHPYGNEDGGAIRGNANYPARCYEMRSNGKRCAGQILEVED